ERGSELGEPVRPERDRHQRGLARHRGTAPGAQSLYRHRGLAQPAPGLERDGRHPAVDRSRSQPSSQWSYSVNVYHDYSDNIRTTDVISQVPLQVTFGNGMTTSTTGLTAWATWKPLDNWRFQGGFMTLRESHSLQPQSLASSIPAE